MNKLSILLVALVTFSSVKADINPWAEAGLIVGGIVQGALKAEMPNLNTCVWDAEKFSYDIYQAVLAFEQKTFDGVALGIRDIGLAVEEVATALLDCKNVTADIEYLKTMAEVFKSPESFIYHMEEDLIVNGVSIYFDIN